MDGAFVSVESLGRVKKEGGEGERIDVHIIHLVHMPVVE